MNATQDESTREETPFRDVLPEVMAECGIEDLNELYSRYLEAGGKWSKRRFMRHARAEHQYLSNEFFAPVAKALGLRDPDWPLYRRLLYAYAMRYGAHRPEWPGRR